MKLNKSYSQTLDQLQSSSSSDPSSSHLDYNENEQKLSDKFNELYFSASIHCGGYFPFLSFLLFSYMISLLYFSSQFNYL